MAALAVAATCILVAMAETRVGWAADEISPDRQASILVRALAYNRNLKTQAGDDFVLAVVYQRNNTASEECGRDAVAAFRGFEKFVMEGLPFRVAPISYESASAMNHTLTRDGVDAVYVCGGLDSELDAIATLAQERKAVSIGALREYVTRKLSLGVFIIDGKPRILVNLPESKREGADFGSDFLRLATLVEDAK